MFSSVTIYFILDDDLRRRYAPVNAKHSHQVRSRRQAYRDVEYNTGKHFFVIDLREIY